MSNVEFIRTRKLGFNRKNKRLWITPRVNSDAGFDAGTVVYVKFGSKNDVPILTISHSSIEGSEALKVADTSKGGVIDINNQKITTHFNDYDQVQIKVENGLIKVSGHHHESKIIEREESYKRRLETYQPLRKGGLFVGTGLLCRSIHRGLKTSGVNVKQLFANEYEPLSAEANVAGNETWDDAMPNARFVLDDIYTMDMRLVPKLDMVVIGSPCPAFSKANVEMKNQGKSDIFHPESGTIFQPILNFIQTSNPALVILENSRFFKDSIFDYIMGDVMGRLGYKSTDTVVTGQDFGAFERRERLCRVWVSKGLALPNVDLLHSLHKSNDRTVRDVIEPYPLDGDGWRQRAYLEAKDAQTHNGHKYFLVKETDTKLPVLSASYAKIQPDSPLLSHPTLKGFSRILTPSEHCNIRNIFGRLKEEICAIAEGHHPAKDTTASNNTLAHRMLGNSVTSETWEAVGEWLGWWMQSLIGRKLEAQHVPATGDQLSMLFAA